MEQRHPEFGVPLSEVVTERIKSGAEAYEELPEHVEDPSHAHAEERETQETEVAAAEDETRELAQRVLPTRDHAQSFMHFIRDNAVFRNAVVALNVLGVFAAPFVKRKAPLEGHTFTNKSDAAHIARAEEPSDASAHRSAHTEETVQHIPESASVVQEERVTTQPGGSSAEDASQPETTSAAQETYSFSIGSADFDKLMEYARDFHAPEGKDASLAMERYVEDINRQIEEFAAQHGTTVDQVDVQVSVAGKASPEAGKDIGTSAVSDKNYHLSGERASLVASGLDAGGIRAGAVDVSATGLGEVVALDGAEYASHRDDPDAFAAAEARLWQRTKEAFGLKSNAELRRLIDRMNAGKIDEGSLTDDQRELLHGIRDARGVTVTLEMRAIGQNNTSQEDQSPVPPDRAKDPEPEVRKDKRTPETPPKRAKKRIVLVDEDAWRAGEPNAVPGPIPPDNRHPYPDEPWYARDPRFSDDESEKTPDGGKEPPQPPTPEPLPPPVDTPPVDTPPIDTPPIDTPPIDTPPIDTPPIDTPPVDTPPVDTPPPPRPRRIRRPFPPPISQPSDAGMTRSKEIQPMRTNKITAKEWAEAQKKAAQKAGFTNGPDKGTGRGAVSLDIDQEAVPLKGRQFAPRPRAEQGGDRADVAKKRTLRRKGARTAKATIDKKFGWS